MFLVIKGLNVNFPKYEFAPNTYTELKFPNATYINWRVTAYSEHTPFFTYLMDEESFLSSKTTNEFGTKEWGYGTSSIGSAGYDGSKTKYLVFYNPSSCYVVSNFAVTDAGFIGRVSEYMGPWSKMISGVIVLLTLLTVISFGIKKGIQYMNQGSFEKSTRIEVAATDKPKQI